MTILAKTSRVSWFTFKNLNTYPSKFPINRHRFYVTLSITYTSDAFTYITFSESPGLVPSY